jgi:hypothetical protein
MKGLATACKDRWCVILPRYLPPRDGEVSGTVRVMLWMYRDAASVEPRTRVWLDGASAMRAGAQGGEVLLVRGRGVVLSVDVWGGRAVLVDREGEEGRQA